jgi:putative NADH-flavin reductase
MKIAVFGASGKTGILLVYQALEKGHSVVAFARNPDSVHIQHRNLQIIRGDILDYEKVKEAVAGQDVVMSTLGVNERKYNTILSDGTRNIIRAMKECGVKRLIVMSSAGVLGNDGGFIFGKIMVPLMLKQIMADKVRQLEVVRASGLEWVVIRPPYLTDSPKTGKYRISSGLPEYRKVPRNDVADFMLRLMTDKQYDGQVPAIAGY